MKIQDPYFAVKRDDSLGNTVALPSEIYRQSANGAAIGASSAMFRLVERLVVAAIMSGDSKDYELYRLTYDSM
jgi:hypothetical protein